jgi:hypothetical protein
MKLYRIGNHLKPHKYQTKNFFKGMSNNNPASDKINQGKPATVDDYQDTRHLEETHQTPE